MLPDCLVEGGGPGTKDHTPDAEESGEGFSTGTSGSCVF